MEELIQRYLSSEWAERGILQTMRQQFVSIYSPADSTISQRSV